MSRNPRQPPQVDPAAGEDFDRRLRLHYWQASAQLSAHSQAQLRQRLRAATSPRAESARVASIGSRRVAWSLAVVGSLALAFAVGLRWQEPDAMRLQPSTITSNASGSDQLVATLDETPDLYLWVASGDAATMTSE